MSAFDIAGAVVATPLAVVFAVAMIKGLASRASSDDLADVMLRLSAVTLWAAFCIARLCGATL